MKFYGLFALLLSVASPAAWGQVLSDPTRPLFSGDSADPASGLAAYPQVKGLQSVIVSSTRCAAIIDGKTVVLGAKYGSETLVDVTERGIVLQGEHGRRIMTLFPTVGMKIIAPAKDQQTVKCKIGQNKQIKSPAKQAVQKEKK